MSSTVASRRPRRSKRCSRVWSPPAARASRPIWRPRCRRSATRACSRRSWRSSSPTSSPRCPAHPVRRARTSRPWWRGPSSSSRPRTWRATSPSAGRSASSSTASRSRRATCGASSRPSNRQRSSSSVSSTARSRRTTRSRRRRRSSMWPTSWCRAWRACSTRLGTGAAAVEQRTAVVTAVAFVLAFFAMVLFVFLRAAVAEDPGADSLRPGRIGRVHGDGESPKRPAAGTLGLVRSHQRSIPPASTLRATGSEGGPGSEPVGTGSSDR